VTDDPTARAIGNAHAIPAVRQLVSGQLRELERLAADDSELRQLLADDAAEAAARSGMTELASELDRGVTRADAAVRLLRDEPAFAEAVQRDAEGALAAEGLPVWFVAPVLAAVDATDVSAHQAVDPLALPWKGLVALEGLGGPAPRLRLS
jgi:hypothetical protein